MTSFQLAVPANRRAAARLIDQVHRKLQRAFASKPHVTQTQIAASLGVHRSVINRQLRGHQDMTIGRIGELAWALGMEADLLILDTPPHQGNTPLPVLMNFELRPAEPSSGSTQVVSVGLKAFA